jgi:DNA adenine methylase
MLSGDKVAEYEKIKASYNAHPNGADLLFLSRSCYGGVVRFRHSDGHISTPCGVHTPISPAAFSARVDQWHRRTAGTKFLLLDYEEAMALAGPGDVIYCDPPYRHSQGILYGAQSFAISRLLQAIERCGRSMLKRFQMGGQTLEGEVVADRLLLTY